MEDLTKIIQLLVLALPIAWASWTVTHEEIMREFKEYCTSRSHTCAKVTERKFFYLFTCEYCFSHWCVLFFQVFFQFKIVFEDWRGYLVSIPALVWIANIYMSIYQRIRIDVRKERAFADRAELQTQVFQSKN